MLFTNHDSVGSASSEHSTPEKSLAGWNKPHMFIKGWIASSTVDPFCKFWHVNFEQICSPFFDPDLIQIQWKLQNEKKITAEVTGS